VILRYWDSCCFLAWLQEEDEERVRGCGQVISEAQAGKLRLVTSSLTLAEVLWLRGKPPIPVSEARKVQDFFQHEWIVVRELDRATAEAAREVVWNNGVKPKDAIHVATALLVHGQTPLDQLDTYDDDDLLPLSETLGIPPLKIGHPEIPGKLF
jgi:predicted nucleic acid-binding protein